MWHQGSGGPRKGGSTLPPDLDNTARKQGHPAGARGSLPAALQNSSSVSTVPTPSSVPRPSRHPWETVGTSSASSPSPWLLLGLSVPVPPGLQATAPLCAPGAAQPSPNTPRVRSVPVLPWSSVCLAAAQALPWPPRCARADKAVLCSSSKSPLPPKPLMNGALTGSSLQTPSERQPCSGTRGLYAILRQTAVRMRPSRQKGQRRAQGHVLPGAWT